MHCKVKKKKRKNAYNMIKNSFLQLPSCYPIDIYITENIFPTYIIKLLLYY
jgi:hypothetical protein